VLLVPTWAADERFPGQETAQALNDVAHRLQAGKTFGTNPVLINYTAPVPTGNPAFAMVALGRGHTLPQ